MTNAPPKKRHRFQLHLSTCVVLMFVAGALVWANVVESRCGIYTDVDSTTTYNYEYMARGWPWVVLVTAKDIYLVDKATNQAITNVKDLARSPSKPYDLEEEFNVVWRGTRFQTGWNEGNVIKNLVAGLAILFVFAMFIEFSIRSRKTEK